MKILVTGDRDWNKYDSIVDAFESVVNDYNIEPSDIILINGDCRGLDKMAAEIGTLLGMDVRSYPAHWRHTDKCLDGCRKMVGRPAGVIRNKEMLDENPDIELALAFHPNLSESKGTRDMIRRLEKAGTEYRHIDK